MAKTATLLTPEETVAKYAEIQEKRRVSCLNWTEKNDDRYRANLRLYYQNNKERLNARKTELRREKSEMKKTLKMEEAENPLFVFI